MSQQLPETWFITDSRLNAVLTWVLVALLVLVAVGAFLDGLLVRMVLAGVAAFVALAPALARRSWTFTVPWPLLLVCSLPLVTGTLEPTLLTGFVTGLSIAALGMLVVVALQLTTTVRMTPLFAVVFVVLATMATAGFWALGSAASARWLGTTFLETNDELMYVFTVAMLSGLVAGGVFRLYFATRLRANRARAGGEEVWAP
jgi:glucan phosphoethanolaminetransferase (alkaline phosphatase superfamily)